MWLLPLSLGQTVTHSFTANTNAVAYKLTRLKYGSQFNVVTCTCTCTCRWWAIEASALEQAHILVVIQPVNSVKYLGSHPAASWRSWLMVPITCCGKEFQLLTIGRRTSWHQVCSVSCITSDCSLSYVDWNELTGRRFHYRHFLFQTRSWKFL